MSFEGWDREIRMGWDWLPRARAMGWSLCTLIRGPGYRYEVSWGDRLK